MRKEHGLGLGRPCAAVAESRAQLGIFGREIGDVGQREILQLRKDHDLAREPSLHERAQSFGRGLHPADGPEGMARRQLAGEGLADNEGLVGDARSGRAGVLRAVQEDAREINARASSDGQAREQNEHPVTGEESRRLCHRRGGGCRDDDVIGTATARLVGHERRQVFFAGTCDHQQSPAELLRHGLESSPQGVKAQLIARHFTARTPAMDTRDFAASVRAQAEALREFDPHVVVGSSYGGAIAVELLQRGLWRGPTLLLAQAALRRGQPAVLPAGVAIWLVHGTRDAIIDPEDSRVLARSGSPEHVRLIEVDVEDGRLVAWIEELISEARR